MILIARENHNRFRFFLNSFYLMYVFIRTVNRFERVLKQQSPKTTNKQNEKWKQ